MKLSQRIALNSTVQAARQIFTALVGILSVGIVTRYLSVDNYGAVLAGLVLVTLFSLATDFGVSAMTVRAMSRDPDREVAIQSSAFWVWVACTVPTALLIYGISLVAYPGPEHATTRTAVLVLLTIFPLGPFAGVAYARAMADQRIWVVSVAGIVARALSLGAIVAVVAMDLGPIGIAGAFASGYVIEQLLEIAFVRPKIAFGEGLHRARIWSLVVAAVPLGTVMVINGLYFRLDAFLLSLLGTERDVAVYGVAYKGFESLLALPNFVMITLIPVLSKLEFDSPRYQELVQKAFSAMVILALPIMGFALFGSEAMVALGGAKYSSGGLVLAMIMCAVAFSCVQAVFGNAMVTQGRQGQLLKVSVSVLVANGLLNLAAIPLFGDRGAAGALILTELLSILFTGWVYSRHAPLPRIYRPVRSALALLMLVVVGVLCLQFDSDLVALAVGVPLGLAAYGGALIALDAVPSFLRESFVSMLGRDRDAAPPVS